ncbi:hypothetical protein [Streptomyces albogriseolus]|uniref:hypothetical protein n=1 Tax=Streptomyces albogriseolus TaxID=1887 RepID=UPI003827BCDC
MQLDLCERPLIGRRLCQIGQRLAAQSLDWRVEPRQQPSLTEHDLFDPTRFPTVHAKPHGSAVYKPARAVATGKFRKAADGQRNGPTQDRMNALIEQGLAEHEVGTQGP